MCIGAYSLNNHVRDSTSNNEIIVWPTAKRLDRHRVQQNIAYLVIIIMNFIFNFEKLISALS